MGQHMNCTSMQAEVSGASLTHGTQDAESTYINELGRIDSSTWRGIAFRCRLESKADFQFKSWAIPRSLRQDTQVRYHHHGRYTRYSMHSGLIAMISMIPLPH